jgi:putative aldouronate transport system permease protein
VKNREMNFFQQIKRNRHLYLMLLPVVAGFILFHYIPIFFAIVVGFKNYSLANGIFGSSWNGIGYFKQFIDDPFFIRLVRNTLLLGFFTFLFSFPASIVLALLLNEIKNKTFKKLTQSISYLPYFISIVVVVSMMYTIVGSEGVLNSIITAMGGEPINFINDPKYFRALYIISNLWQTIGWGSILYLAALTGINHELYEAAYIDGANRWHRMKYVTLPGIAPTILILFIIQLGNIINVGYEKVIVMYHPGIYETADIIQTYTYRLGVDNLNFGYAGAVNLFNAAISITLVVLANYIVKKKTEEGLW